MPEDWAGVVYILTNPSFKDLVKIGYADDLKQRIKSLNSSPAVPYRFHAYAYYNVTKRLDDRIIHKLIDALNPDLRTIETEKGKKREREFYAMTPEDAYAILEGIAKISGTTDRLHRVKPDKSAKDDEQSAEEDQIKTNERRSPFSFAKCGIPKGAEIHFKDHPEYVAKVLDEKYVEYNGGTYTTTSLTRELMKELEGRDMHAWQGPKYWTYEGRPLSDIRAEREANGTYK